MHIDIVPNRDSPPAVLLRESYREGGKVKKRTLANLSKLPLDQVELIRQVLKGQRLAPIDQLFEVTRSRHHGHVEAVLRAIKKLKLDKLIAPRHSRQRDLVLAMIVARLLDPASKLATVRSWQTTTLPEILGVEDADEDELYEAMDWLLGRQQRIEKKLAARHLEEGGLALFDLTSSYFEGRCCPLAARGHNRDGKRGKLQVNYGLLTDGEGRPVAISVFEGNTNDAKTLLPQVDKIQQDFQIKQIVIVGDRGMISQKQIDALKDKDGVSWITALNAATLRRLVDQSAIQLGLFDERNLFEFEHQEFPGERLIACRNPELADRRVRKRQSLLEATVKELDKVATMVSGGRLAGKGKIGVRVGRVINKYKMAKHFRVTIEEESFAYTICEESVRAEAALDGIYVIRTAVKRELLDDEKTVLAYKSLSAVEQAFRQFKGLDLLVRPIHHRLEERVRAHLLICMLAYYVQWHLIAAWRPLLFYDEEQQAKEQRDPVKPAERSESALKKAHSRKLPDGSEVHSLRTLFKSLSTIVRNTCQRGGNDAPVLFDVDTRPNAKQLEALSLIDTLAV